MSVWHRLNRGETEIDFVGHRRRWLIFSSVALVLAIASLGIRQVNLGIEFVGGWPCKHPIRPRRMWRR